MENLTSEKIINKNEKLKLNIEKEKKDENTDNENDIKNNKDEFPTENNENNNDNEKNKIVSTDFVETIELTEEEKKLRNDYLKKVTKKEALIRSIILGRKQYYVKLYSFITNIIYNIINIKETKYKADAINSITAKDLDKFIISVKYHIITIAISKVMNFFDDRFFKILNKDVETNNIMLENLLFNKDIVFF